jgi:hypothetical protein
MLTSRLVGHDRQAQIGNPIEGTKLFGGEDRASSSTGGDGVHEYTR